MPTRREVLMAAGACALSACADRSQENKIMLRAADVHVESYPTVVAMRQMNDTLQRESGGRIQIDVYHAGQLGREALPLELR